MKYGMMAAAVALALASVGPGVAQTTTTTETTTTRTTLTPEQRTVFREYYTREQKPSVMIEKFEVNPGVVLPPSVQFYSVPQVETYQYGYINNRHVVVEPSSRRVIEVFR